MTAFSENAFKKIENKTASYVMVPEDLGTLFTTRGATTPTFTLPVTGDIQNGWWCEVHATVDSAVTVQSAAASTVTTFNNLTASSVAWGGTGVDIIGGAWRFVWDGTGWLVFIMAEETQTMTVA